MSAYQITFEVDRVTVRRRDGVSYAWLHGCSLGSTWYRLPARGSDEASVRALFESQHVRSGSANCAWQLAVAARIESSTAPITSWFRL